jgi:selenocysteine lyase/cysteine desulfurase
LGAIELDVRSLGADAVAGGTVKYLLGTAGLGFMWLRPEVCARLLPTQTGWFADEDIFAMSIADYSPHASARRFDAGTPPVPSLYAGVAGVSLVEEAGVPAIEEHVGALVDRLLDGLDALDATVSTPRDPRRRGPLVCVRSADVVALVAERIVVSSREDKLRLALHLYNVDEDVDTLLDALARHRALLA